jgi:hypothetical protein
MWMCHIGKVKADSVVMAVILNFSLRQVGSIVGDDAMWDAESYHSVLDKLKGSFVIKLSNGLRFNPLHEFIDRY